MKPEILYLQMWAGDPVHERKLSGMRRYAGMRDWRVVAADAEESSPSGIREILKTRRVAGCVVECSAGRVNLPPSTFGTTPVVYLDCDARLYRGRAPRILHDGLSTVREAFRELASNHPRAYAVVGHAAGYFWSKLRVKAFREMVERGGGKCRVFAQSGRARATREVRLSQWVARLPEKCAVFAVNDCVAREVIDACARANRRIPKEISLVGVDNNPVCESTNPTISSVQVDFERAGFRALKLLDGLLSGRREKEETFGPLMVVRRRTTRGFGRDEPRLLKAIDVIRARACNGLRARDVVAMFGGSRRLVDLRFREVFGHSILDEIMNVRFEKVFFLLSRTRTALSAIASQCGFGSEVTLRQLFHRRTGLSMRSWREQNAE